MGVELAGEISMVVYEFDLILESEIVADKERFKETDSRYGTYRALKETLRSEKVNRMKLVSTDFYSIANHLLDDTTTTEAFSEWIRTREFEWEMKTLPRNASRLYAVGKQEVLRREGKKKPKY